MISGLLKAQLVAFLTAKLVQSPLFNRGVARAHGTFTELSEQAYSALERATLDGQKAIPTQHQHQSAPRRTTPTPSTSSSPSSSSFNRRGTRPSPPPPNSNPIHQSSSSSSSSSQTQARSPPPVDETKIKEIALREYIERMRKDLAEGKKL